MKKRAALVPSLLAGSLLLAAALTVYAAPSAAATKRPTLRLWVLRDGAELLGSEQRALAQIERALKKRFTLDAKPPSAAEEKFARTCLGVRCDASALPPGFDAHAHVLVLRIVAYLPAQVGKRLSGGFADVLLFSGGSTTPVFGARVDDAASLPVQSAPGEWLADLVSKLGEGQ